MMLERLRRDETGAVVVEFALVVPFFMLIVFAIIDFSRAYYLLNTVNSTLREGARYGSTLRDTEDPSTAKGRNQIKLRMRNFSTAFGSPIDTSKVAIAFDNATVTVSVTNYPFTLVTPLTKVLASNLIKVSRSAQFRWEGVAPGAGI